MEFMGNYVQNNLSANELIISETKLHWINFAWSIIFVLFTISTELYGLLMISTAIAIAALIKIFNSEFAVTTKRVIIKVGLISRRTLEINLTKIESVNINQNFLGRLLNYGTIVIIGTGGTKQIFHKIDKPIEFRKTLLETQSNI